MCILYAFVFTRVHTSACARLYMPTCVRECTVYMRTFIYVHLALTLFWELLKGRSGLRFIVCLIAVLLAYGSYQVSE